MSTIVHVLILYIRWECYNKIKQSEACSSSYIFNALRTGSPKNRYFGKQWRPRRNASGGLLCLLRQNQSSEKKCNNYNLILMAHPDQTVLNFMFNSICPKWLNTKSGTKYGAICPYGITYILMGNVVQGRNHFRFTKIWWKIFYQ